MCHLQGMSCKQWLTMLAPAKFTTESNTKQPDLVSTFAYVLSFFQYKSATAMACIMGPTLQHDFLQG